ncbi:putative Ig domain-containing protein [Jatrophihabitans cynanchi]|uniref:Ig domain-containing protein n=1 Tax=Jatrophihabitans cynanchi TaxID=2944128 RepID=A0ABY7K3A0_9ACTN|nr:putative Ig domain-containing protein [Jatrophihabitans sp. SB3-54]WAX58670.1 putative Ig domain-containing protein [Jatrophihabitans sp. SB3-54]
MAARLSLRSLLARRRRASDEDGFVLLESIVAISIITIIMSALGVMFLGTMASANQQRAKQGAIQVADSTLETLRGLHPSSLISGRDQSSVSAQFGAATTLVAPWLATMDQAYDTAAAAGSGATAKVPTSPTTVKPNTISYAVNQYLGSCYLNTDVTNSNCVPKAQAPAGAAEFVRAVIAVSWTGAHCNLASCSYVTATLLSPMSDPVFKLNQPLPAAPVLASSTTLSYAVGDDVLADPSAQLTVASGGVPQFFWAITSGALPTGVTMSTLGQLSGSPDLSTANKTFTMTVKITDAFLRSDTGTLVIKVLPPLVATCPANQSAFYNESVGTVSATATGGTGTGYTWSDPGTSLPPGLSISSAGAITGKPTTVGTYPVTVKVADSSGTRTKTCSFQWTVNYRPLGVTNPGPQVSTVGAAPSPAVQLLASGGSGQYTWTATGLPAGLSLTSGGLITGAATTVGTTSVTATVTDTKAGFTQQLTFAWTVAAKPTVKAIADQTSTQTGTVTVPVTTTCDNTPCTYTLNNAPAGLTATASAIGGTITGAAGSYSSVTLTVKDADGVSVTSPPFSWTVNPAPSITDPGDQEVAPNGTVGLTLSTAGGTGGLTLTASGLPTWLSMDATGKFTGTAPATRGAAGTVIVKATDSLGVSASISIKWYVDDLKWTTIPDQSTQHSTSRTTRSGSLSLSGYVLGGSGTKSYALVSPPAWMSLSGSTISVTAPTSTTSKTITVKVGDGTGYSVTTSFTWTIT